MKLSDTELVQALFLGKVKIDPPAELNEISGVTIPLHLGNEFIDISKKDVEFIDPELDNSTLFETIEGKDYYDLAPGSLTLAVTDEQVTLPADLLGRLDGRSRLARLGVTVHITAHRIDPGFNGRIVLEIFNCSKNTIRLKHKSEVAALLLEKVSGEVARPYNCDKSKYKNQKGVSL